MLPRCQKGRRSLLASQPAVPAPSTRCAENQFCPFPIHRKTHAAAPCPICLRYGVVAGLAMRVTLTFRG
jgi:hypothetical protein